MGMLVFPSTQVHILTQSQAICDALDFWQIPSLVVQISVQRVPMFVVYCCLLLFESVMRGFSSLEAILALQEVAKKLSLSSYRRLKCQSVAVDGTGLAWCWNWRKWLLLIQQPLIILNHVGFPTMPGQHHPAPLS